MKQKISGQASERNLVAVINKHAPFKMTLGTKTYTVTGAKQLGGGNPEPKADIAILTKNGDIGVSMKKPNFGFFESWMNEEKTLNMLTSVGIDEGEAQFIVDGLKAKAKKVTNSKTFKEEVIAEFKAAVEIIGKSHASIPKMKNSNGKFIIAGFRMDGSTKNDLVARLLKDKQQRFGKTAIGSTFRVENVYAPLKSLLGQKYKSFLHRIIGGVRTGPNANRFPADYVLEAEIQKNTKEDALIKILQTMQSIDEVVNKYADSDEVNLKFRLRPITAIRAAYSTTNGGKYKKGAQFYADTNIGVSWTVHVAV
jgi:hypothetical protein